MTLQTITLARPLVLPQGADCDCCAEHLVEALQARAGVAEARVAGAQLVLQVDAQLVPADAAERLAREAGQQIGRRYDHPIFAVEGLDCADCARTLEQAVARLGGVHYATLNFGSARLRLEYDREQTSVEAIVALGRDLGYQLRLPQAASSLVCTVEGMCCAVEAGQLEQALRGLPGVQQAAADPALARLSVLYDPQALSQAQIVARVEQLGMRIQSAPAASASARGDATPARLRGWLAERPRDALTALCGLLIATAWLAGWLGAPALSDGLFVAATLAGSWFVARSGWASLRATRALDINMLMVVAAIGALAIGEYSEGAAVVFLFALGNALEGYTMERARRSIRALMQLAPATARVLRARGENQEPSELIVPIEQVAVGETIVVRPGDRVALDAVVLAGESAVDQAPITGESVPVAKSPGAELFAGTINGEGALEARVTRLARDSTLARIIELVESAQAQKSRAQRLVDQFARRYTPAVIVLALLVMLLPPLLAGAAWGVWFYRALVLLVIACPCALVISTPVSVVSAISAAARAGVLFKGGAALEAAGGLRAIAFDKTGTLTAGKPVVTDIVLSAECSVLSYHNVSDKFPQHLSTTETTDAPDDSKLNTQNLELLRLAAAVERRSAHPLARAIAAEAEARGLAIPPAADFQSRSGRGAQATVNGQAIVIGNRAMLGGLALPADLEQRMSQLERQGRTVMLVARDGAPIGLIAVADQLRPASRAAVAALRGAGIAHVAMLTGDAAPVAEQIGREAGVDSLRAELLPDQKLAAIGELIERHGSVAMVGDGVNDAPALARATVGIAMGAAGSDAALETADVTLMTDDLARLPFVIGLSRATRQIIWQNVVFALAVKLLFLAATLAGVATLWMAVFADTGAALIVIANGMRLLRQRA